MFEKTDSQDGLFSLKNQLPENVQERLRDSWAHGFAVKVMPVLLDVEQEFAGLYDQETGRPCWSVARKLGICLLQGWFGLPDQEALDNLVYDIRWQYALGVSPDEAYLSRRSLVQFRSDLVDYDPEMELVGEVFERITDEALDDLDIEVDEQRADSTQIVSNIQCRGRVWLFGETLMKFVRRLRDEESGRYRQLPDRLVDWFERRTEGEGWFGRGGTQEAELEQLAEWLVEMVMEFRGADEIAEWEAFELVERLVDEHCEIEQRDAEDASDPAAASGEAEQVTGREIEDVRIELRDKPINGGASMQTPHDPDAGYGNKGLGYTVHLIETCNNDSTEMLTGWRVQPANHNDWGTTPALYDRLESAGWKPSRLYADAGYPTTKSLVDALQRGSLLHAPVSDEHLPEDYTGREAFEFDEQGRLEECPEGHEPLEHRERQYGSRDEPLLHAVMEAGDCQNCRLQGKCPASHSHGDKWYVPLGRRLRRRDEALVAQKDSDWWDAYQIRSGIEATVSELKAPHGMDELRVRGQSRVEFEVGMKVTACNIKRWLRELDPGQRGQITPHSYLSNSSFRSQNACSAAAGACRIHRSARGQRSPTYVPAGFRPRTRTTSATYRSFGA